MAVSDATATQIRPFTVDAVSISANLTYSNEVERGNHFAAWREAELLTSEVRAAFRSPRG